MSSTLIEVECQQCGCVFMAEQDNETLEFSGGCPDCNYNECED